MHRLAGIAILIVGCLCFTNPTHAQLPYPGVAAPATKLESLETNVSVVILKGATALGSVPGKAGVVAVKCRQTTDTSTGRMEQGIAVEIAQKGQPTDTMLVDYDEIVRLLAAIEYLSRLDPSVTPLAAFNAAYTTRGGLRVAALGTRRAGAVQFAVRDVRAAMAPVVLSPEGMATFSGLINQGKATLDSLGGGAAATPSASFTMRSH
ncbi:MAG: hypothetical protein ACLQM8_28850 [Limisphaerales bacterium]